MTPITQTADELFPELARYQRQLLAGGGVGLLISLVEFLFKPTQFYQSYLMGYMFCLSVTLGCLALGMVHQLSGGAWGIVIRRPIGAASRLLPLMTLLFLPVVVGMNNLYPWTHAAVVARDELLQAKRAYLNVPFFLLRAAIYFAVWNATSHWLNRWAAEQDRTGDPEIARKMQKVSAAGLVLYGLSVTFASFDWLMSLEPDWYSTIYGVLVMGGQGLSAMAFLIGVLVWLSRRPPLDRIIVKAHFHDLGNLMLAFVMLWAYFGFSQYLIIWAGNLPQEISWYAHRLQTGWRFVGITLILFHFVVPFVLLLSRTMKREADLILKVAIGILFVRLVDLFWLIAPEFHTGGLAVSWLDIVLPVSLGAVWLGFFISQLRRRTILPVHDPEFEEALGQVALT
ncbi:MAG TPA: hypothetical protein VGZ27_20020 [Vicinamibacterales bacterium]|jgi:hypothetical protein|nr:hypothetical protein [Vicinamibacterales bacterium]